MIEKDISIASIQIHCIGRQLFLRRNVKNLHLCPVISIDLAIYTKVSVILL